MIVEREAAATTFADFTRQLSNIASYDVSKYSFFIHSRPSTELEPMSHFGQLIPTANLLSPAQLDIAHSRSPQSPSHLWMNRSECLDPSVTAHPCRVCMHG